ncbi:MAG: hypothetical protein AAF941_07090 [Pseudomonadota bacterium]
MSNFAPVHSISVDIEHAELHFAIGGLWTFDAMKDFLYELGEAAKPFMKERKPFSSAGDLREFVPQNRETADAIRDTLLLGQKNGMKRFAVVTTSPLVKMQYRRLTSGLEVEFFDVPAAAQSWLRSST